MPKIKYLLLTRWLPPPFLGGSGRYLYNILRFMPDDTVVFTEKSRAPGDPKELRLRFIRRGYISPFDPPDDSRIVRKLKKLRMLVFWVIELLVLFLKQRPECVLIGQVDLVGPLGWFLKRLFGVPYVVFVYAEELTSASNFRQSIARFVCRSANRVVTISDFSVGLVRDMGIAPDRIILARPGIDVAAFEVSDRQKLAAFRITLAPEDHKILLTVGRLTKRKGHAEVISVLPKILRLVPKVRYVIAGAAKGEERNLKALVKKLGLEEQVVFLGRVSEDDIPLLYNACNVFIMANYELPNKDTEGFGIVFLEANAAGKPVIGGRTGGATDAVADEVSGLLVDATNPDELYAAVVRLLQDEPHAKQLGEQGYQRVKSEFSWEQTAATVQKCLEGVVR